VSSDSARRPWLSVLMPTLNGGAFLAHALSSVERERDPGVECIVVDGGSMDETVGIARSFADRLNLRILERRDSPGWVWSTNLALAEALAPHACMLHQDDEWRDGRTARVKAMITQRPDAVLFVHATRYIDVDGRAIGTLSCPWPESPPALTSVQTLPALMVQNFIAASAPVFSTDAARSVGGLDESLWYTADWDLWLKLAGRGDTFHSAEVLSSFRIHSGSQTAMRSIDATDFLAQLDRVVDTHLGRIKDPGARESVRNQARFSNRINAALAQRSHGGSPDWSALARLWFSMRASEWVGYYRHSRIAPRLLSRLRVRARA
jgi:GT2 family glycosyltransferase